MKEQPWGGETQFLQDQQEGMKEREEEGEIGNRGKGGWVSSGLLLSEIQDGRSWGFRTVKERTAKVPT